MFNIKSQSVKFGNSELHLETGKIARQANGAVMATLGGTKVLCAVTISKDPLSDLDFLPLSVHYLEKYSAAGKIPGGFNKRESKPSEREVLTSRLIDRSLRPTFADGFYYEVQIVCTVLSFDGVYDSDVLALIGASAALAITNAPVTGIIAASKVGVVNKQLVLNPLLEQMEESDLELMIAGTNDSVLMVESEVNNLQEADMLAALKFGHQGFQKVIKAIEALKAEVNNKAEFVLSATDQKLLDTISKNHGAEITKAFAITEKQQRRDLLNVVKTKVLNELVSEEVSEVTAKSHLKKVESKVMRGQILDDKKRPDGRDPEQIRQIIGEVDLLPHVHGSALFTRGETQSICSLTLGTGDDEQIVDTIVKNDREKFLLHYNFPAYSVGETGPMRAPGRREIGHGKLASRSLVRMMPSHEQFPYTIRLISDITESNGSSSMATVCGCSMAMMAGGVPVKAPVAGIAMGLILEGKNFTVLSDINGDEDHLGDMDFKVAGTETGITALQMDIKVAGISFEIMEQAIKQAKAGRLHILGEMAKTIDGPREQLSEHAPVLGSMRINPDKIREVIGSGGKVIREICEQCEAKIDIEEDGKIKIFAPNQAKMNEAKDIIHNIVVEPEVGSIYDAKVVKITEYGAFVEYLGKNSGLVHVSEIAEERVEDVNDYLKLEQMIKVKLVGIDNRGKARLSMRAAVEGAENSKVAGDKNTKKVKTDMPATGS
ncbi:MAG: polyribonucleotide nucleotidyltransferase [Pseudomonadota bacterium]